MRPILLAAAVALAAVTATAIPAGATGQCSASTMVISAYAAGDMFQPVDDLILKCEPTGGNHPEAEGACASLKAVDGDFDRLPDRGVMCPDSYLPVTVEVGGSWRGRAIKFERIYPNGCFAYSASDGVFDFS